MALAAILYLIALAAINHGVSAPMTLLVAITWGLGLAFSSDVKIAPMTL